MLIIFIFLNENSYWLCIYRVNIFKETQNQIEKLKIRKINYLCTQIIILKINRQKSEYKK